MQFLPECWRILVFLYFQVVIYEDRSQNYDPEVGYEEEIQHCALLPSKSFYSQMKSAD